MGMTPLHQLVDLARSQDMAWDAAQEHLTAELLRPAMPGIVDTLGRRHTPSDSVPSFATGSSRASFAIPRCDG